MNILWEQEQWTVIFEKELDNFTKVLKEVMNKIDDNRISVELKFDQSM